MRFGIFGAGAVGGYFGGRLAESGQEVVFVARGRQLEALSKHGLRIESPHGNLVVKPVRVTDDPGQAGPVDVVLICVKAWQVRGVAASIDPMLGPETFVVPLQNGVEAPDLLIETLGRERVLGGTCKIISKIAEPGLIRHLGVTPQITIGELDDRSTPRLGALRQALIQAGIEVVIPDSIRIAIWRKFLIMAGVSGMGAVTRVPLGVYRSAPETRGMLAGVLQEVWQLARAHGVELPDDAVAETLDFIDRLPAEGTSSMQRDIMEARPSELDSLNGAIVRLGRAAGVATPLNGFIYHSLLPMERIARADQG